jgi:hypothetical protein
MLIAHLQGVDWLEGRPAGEEGVDRCDALSVGAGHCEKDLGQGVGSLRTDIVAILPHQGFLLRAHLVERVCTGTK